jgi:imidazolonepropionase-like amidohydrolase
LPPAQVLASATGIAAAAAGLKDRGRVRSGRRADLLLVRGDPSQDAESLDDIEAVILGGKFIKVDVLP